MSFLTAVKKALALLCLLPLLAALAIIAALLSPLVICGLLVELMFWGYKEIFGMDFI